MFTRATGFVKRLLNQPLKGLGANITVFICVVYLLFVASVGFWLMFISDTIRGFFSFGSHHLDGAILYLFWLVLGALFLLAWGFFMASAMWWQIVIIGKLDNDKMILADVLSVALAVLAPWIYWFWGSMDLVSTGLLATGQGLLAMLFSMVPLAIALRKTRRGSGGSIGETVWQSTPLIVGGVVWVVLVCEAWNNGLLHNPLWFVLLIAGGVSGLRAFKQNFMPML